MNIGVFDSGFGGLSVFKAIRKKLPDFDYIYLGDSARSPYGNNSHDVIYRYVREAVNYLFINDCQLVILACNTASAQALRRLQQEWLPAEYPDRRVLGVIRPVAEAAAALDGSGKIGVIGTRATIKAGVYTKEIEKALKARADILEQSCPLLVPMIEEGFHKRPEMKKILRYYLRPFKNQGVKILINGCTHYQLLHDLIQKNMGKNVFILDTAEVVADSLADYLKRHVEVSDILSKNGQVDFLTTGEDAERFNRLASQFYGQPVKARRITLTGGV